MNTSLFLLKLLLSLNSYEVIVKSGFDNKIIVEYIYNKMRLLSLRVSHLWTFFNCMKIVHGHETHSNNNLILLHIYIHYIYSIYQDIEHSLKSVDCFLQSYNLYIIQYYILVYIYMYIYEIKYNYKRSNCCVLCRQC